MKAKSLRSTRKADGQVRFRGRPSPPKTARTDERRNLPSELEPGVTYENIEIRWRAAARLERRRPAGDGT